MFRRLTINILWVHILALLGCTAYLIGNVMFSVLDKTDYSCLEMTVDPGIYYKPLSFCMLFLVFMGFSTSQFINPIAKDWVKEVWRFYLWLAYSQAIKMWFSNPMIENILDYGFLGIAIIFILINFRKLYIKNRLK